MARAIKVLVVVMGYWAISISMVFINKYLVGSQQSQDDISVFVAWIQCCVSVFMLTLYSTISKLLRHDSAMHKVSYSVCTTRHVLILSVVFVSMLSFNNLCLKHVSIAFYQVARSLTIIFTIIFSIVILRRRVSTQIMMCCFVVALGFFLGIDQENLAGTLSISGVIFGMVTSIFIALSGIYTKKALDVVERNATRLTFYNNLNAVFMFFPLLLFNGQLYNAFLSERMRDPHFWAFLMVSGLMSFLMGWISALQISYTSPVTHHISANTKSVIQTILAVSYFNEHKRALWWLSNALVVGGALGYAIIKVNEDRKHTGTPHRHRVIHLQKVVTKV